MIVLVLMAPPAFAGNNSECSANTAIGEEISGSDVGVRALYFIQQGETDYHSTYVPPGSSTLFVNLDWFNSQQSLTLKIISPGGSTYAYYHDIDLDGSENAQIHTWISSPGSGTWQFQVYGELVRGTQDYSSETVVN